MGAMPRLNLDQASLDRGLDVARFEQGNVLFLDLAENFDESACRSTKFLCGS